MAHWKQNRSIFLILTSGCTWNTISPFPAAFDNLAQPCYFSARWESPGNMPKKKFWLNFFSPLAVGLLYKSISNKAVKLSFFRDFRGGIRLFVCLFFLRHVMWELTYTDQQGSALSHLWPETLTVTSRPQNGGQPEGLQLCFLSWSLGGFESQIFKYKILLHRGFRAMSVHLSSLCCAREIVIVTQLIFHWFCFRSKWRWYGV